MFPRAAITVTTANGSRFGDGLDEFSLHQSPMSFSVSQGAPQVINALVWKQPGSEAEQRFEKSSKSWLLDMPLELLDRVMDFVLTTDTYLKGTIHLHEERKHFVFAESKVVPDGQAMEGKRWGGNLKDLPQRFNQVQYTSRLFNQHYRGVEVAHNTVVCHGFTFDSFREIGRPELRELFANLKRIVLFGKFTLGDCPDERLLHGLFKFGKDNSRVQVRVEVDDMRLTTGRHVQSIVTWVFCIRETSRGVRRPGWAKLRQDRVDARRRGKPTSLLNAGNVRFFPYQGPGTANPQHVAAMVKKSAGKVMQELRNNLRVEGALVDLIKDAAVHSAEDLEALGKKTGADA